MSDDATVMFGSAPAPSHESPEFDEPEIVSGHVPYDARYPDSTKDAPFGYKPDGTPYLRHHGARGGGKSSGPRMPATDKQAEMAASLLARLNDLVGLSLTMAGMPMSALTLASNNDRFREAARDALQADPDLCRKILSTGAVGGKAGLVMAYVILIGSTFPDMRKEYREAHPKELETEE